MKIIHQGGYGKDELALFRLTVYKNLLDCVKSLINAMRQFEIEPQNPENRRMCEFLMDYSVDPDPHSALDPRVGDAVMSVWNDPAMPKVMGRHTEFYLMDSAP